MAKRPRNKTASKIAPKPRVHRTAGPAQPATPSAATPLAAAQTDVVKRKPGRPRKKPPVAPVIAMDEAPPVANPSPAELAPTPAPLETYSVDATSTEPVAEVEADGAPSPAPVETYTVDAAPVEPAPEMEDAGVPIAEIDIGIQAAEEILPVIREDIEAAIEAIQASIEIAVDDSTPSVSFEVKAGEIGSIAAERFQAMTAQLKERIEMSATNGAKIFEQAGELTKGNVEALVASSHIAAKGFEALGQSAAEYGRKQVQEATAAIKNIAEIKSPTDFFNYQSNFARAAFESMMAESSRISDAMIKLASDVSEPIATRYSDAMKQVKSIGL